jgi:hypothetical protein
MRVKIVSSTRTIYSITPCENKESNYIVERRKFDYWQKLLSDFYHIQDSLSKLVEEQEQKTKSKINTEV